MQLLGAKFIMVVIYNSSNENLYQMPMSLARRNEIAVLGLKDAFLAEKRINQLDESDFIMRPCDGYWPSLSHSLAAKSTINWLDQAQTFNLAIK